MIELKTKTFLIPSVRSGLISLQVHARSFPDAIALQVSGAALLRPDWMFERSNLRVSSSMPAPISRKVRVILKLELP